MTASPGMSYASDAVGNRLSRNLGSSSSSAQRFEWDWTNRVKSAGAPSSGARYEYRADGMRTLKIEGLTIAWQYYEEDEKHAKGSGFYDDVWSWNQPTTRYYYDGQMGFEDDYAYQTGSYGSSTSHLDITRYALGAKGIDRIEKVVDSTSSSPSTVIQYPLYDAHGNMVATLSRGSSTGTYTVGNQRAFEPWGSVFDSSGLSNTPKQAYCASLGHVADSELGLTYMRARYYEPGTGRFISEDPARSQLNWYVYAANNPINHADSSGRDIWSAIAAAAGAGIGVYGVYFMLAGTILLCVATDPMDIMNAHLAITAGSWFLTVAMVCISGVSVEDVLGNFAQSLWLDVVKRTGIVCMEEGLVISGKTLAATAAAGCFLYAMLITSILASNLIEECISG